MPNRCFNRWSYSWSGSVEICFFEANFVLDVKVKKVYFAVSSFHLAITVHDYVGVEQARIFLKIIWLPEKKEMRHKYNTSKHICFAKNLSPGDMIR